MDTNNKYPLNHAEGSNDKNTFCSVCGSPVTDKMQFCPQCGNRINNNGIMEDVYAGPPIEIQDEPAPVYAAPRPSRTVNPIEGVYAGPGPVSALYAAPRPIKKSIFSKIKSKSKK